jgi:hypothetical protein
MFLGPRRTPSRPTSLPTLSPFFTLSTDRITGVVTVLSFSLGVYASLNYACTMHTGPTDSRDTAMSLAINTPLHGSEMPTISLR